MNRRFSSMLILSGCIVISNNNIKLDKRRRLLGRVGPGGPGSGAARHSCHILVFIKYKIAQ
jgi:hypothetical protein